MKKYIKTTHFTWYLGDSDFLEKGSKTNNFGKGVWKSRYWNVNRGSLEEGMNALTQCCNENGFEVMGFMPLTKAQAYEYGKSHQWVGQQAGLGWGLGHGWGINMTDGFVAILQSIEMLSDEDYEQRIVEDKRLKVEAQNKERRVAELEAEIKSVSADYESTLLEYKKVQGSEDRKQLQGWATKDIVQESKGLLKKTEVFCIEGQITKYDSREDAQTALDGIKAKVVGFDNQERALKSKLTEYQTVIEKSKEEIKQLTN